MALYESLLTRNGSISGRCDGPLRRLLRSFRHYIDFYESKLQDVHDTLTPPHCLGHFQNVLVRLSRRNTVLLASTHARWPPMERLNEECATPGVTDQRSRHFGTLRAILAALQPYIAKQNDYIVTHPDEHSFREHFGDFLSFINEEASVLFCNRVKDTLELRQAPEKQALIRLNLASRHLLTLTQFQDDTRELAACARDVINAAQSTDDALDGIVHMLKERLGTRCVQVLIIDPESGQIEVRAYAYVPHLPMYRVAHETGLIAECVARGEPLRVNAVLEDPRYDMFDATIKSELVVPILVDGRVRGAINIEDNHLERFSGNLVAAVIEICSLLSARLRRG